MLWPNRLRTSSATPSTTALSPPMTGSAAGKPARGTVSLNAYHQGTQVVIEVRDDGRGIDLDMFATRRFAAG